MIFDGFSLLDPYQFVLLSTFLQKKWWWRSRVHYRDCVPCFISLNKVAIRSAIKERRISLRYEQRHRQNRETDEELFFFFSVPAICWMFFSWKKKQQPSYHYYDCVRIEWEKKIKIWERNFLFMHYRILDGLYDFYFRLLSVKYSVLHRKWWLIFW